MELAAFAPFVQFIAGIYLVSMYDKVLEINPLKKHCDMIINVVRGIANKYQGHIQEDNQRIINDITNNGVNSTHWNRYSPALKFVSTISFFFCLILLFYMGVEKVYVGGEQMLIVPSFTVLAYTMSVVLSTWLRIEFLKTYLLHNNAILYVLMFLIGYIIIFMLFSDLIARYLFCIDNWSKNSVVVLTILASMIGILSYALLYVKVWCGEQSLLSKTKELKSEMDEVYDYNLNVKDRLNDKLWAKIMNCNGNEKSDSISKNIDYYITNNVNQLIKETVSHI